jgi:hypothetical protein
MEGTYDAVNVSAKFFSLRAPVVFRHVAILVFRIFIKSVIRQVIQRTIP